MSRLIRVGVGQLCRAARVVVLSALTLLSHAVLADEATVAVATNFLAPMQSLAKAFATATGHRLEVVSGSTGQLYAQIVNGAPYDVLLAADAERPARLVRDGLAVAASHRTYAIGRIALWSRRAGLVGDTLDGLPQRDFRWLAIANPALAPYGRAAEQALTSLGIYESVAARIVQGQNVGQTFALIESGSADFGFVALSQALAYRGEAAFLIVPDALHDPVNQDAVLLERGRRNPAAVAFVTFLDSVAAAEVLEAFGYEAPAGH